METPPSSWAIELQGSSREIAELDTETEVVQRRRNFENFNSADRDAVIIRITREGVQVEKRPPEGLSYLKRKDLKVG